jgi:hypothetical protein
MFNATINNISVISWRQFYWWRKPEYPEKTTDLTWETRGAINAEQNAIGKSKIIQIYFSQRCMYFCCLSFLSYDLYRKLMRGKMGVCLIGNCSNFYLKNKKKPYIE